MLNKEQLEKIRLKGEQQANELLEQQFGFKFKSQADIDITCIHCKHDRFDKSNALLNTRGMTFLELDWLNESAITLICKKCGFVHWFNKEVTQL